MTKVTQVNFGEDGKRRRLHLREISAESDSPMETVGQDLRAARIRRGDDLATVSQALKIRKDHLEAVEEDNLARLPGKAYAIGFVRSYAAFLGLDAARVVERYKQEISGRHDDPIPSETGFHPDDTYLSYGWRILAGIVLIALVYGIYHLVSGGPAPQPVPPPPSLAPQHSQVAAAKPEPPPLPAPPVTTGTTAVPPPAGASAATPPAPPKPQTSSLTSNAIASAPTQGTATPSPATASVAAAGTGKVYGLRNANPRLVLHVVSNARLTVRGPDGKVYLNSDLVAGDSYQVPHVDGLDLSTSDGGAVAITLDGKDMGKVGKNQEVLGRVSLDPASLVDRFNTH